MSAYVPKASMELPQKCINIKSEVSIIEEGWWQHPHQSVVGVRALRIVHVS